MLAQHPARWESLCHVLAHRARTTPGRTAYVFPEGEECFSLTYQELYQTAKSLAVSISANTSVGARAMLMFPPGPAFAVSFYACLMAGVVAVPFYPPTRRRSDTITRVLADCGASLILCSPQSDTQVQTLLAKGNGRQTTLTVDGKQKSISTETVSTVEVTPDQLAFLQYTSGSTGSPKGVMVRHRDLMANQEAIAAAFQTNEEDICVSWLPNYHDMGLNGTLIHALYAGFTSVLLSPLTIVRDPISWLFTLSRYRATLSGGPNFSFDRCTQKAAGRDLKDLDLSSVRLLFNGAEPVRASTLSSFIETFAPYGLKEGVVFPCYGMAEATLFISGGTYTAPLHVAREALAENRMVADDEGIPLVSSGAPSAAVRIVDPETSRSLGEGLVGEIWFSGPGKAQGYWGMPDLSAATFEAALEGSGQWLRTGDLGAIHQGQLFITGRRKDMIISRGRNLYPQDIEAVAASAHEALSAATTVAVMREGDGTEQLVLLAELVDAKANYEEIAAAVTAAVAGALELHVSSLLLVPRGSLPKTSSGKIQRSACRVIFEENSTRALFTRESIRELGEALPPLNLAALRKGDEKEAHQQLLALLTSEVSRFTQVAQEDIQPDSSLVRLGLDSLRSAELTQSLSERLGVELEPDALASGITLRELTRTFLAANDALLSLPEEETSLLSFEQERLWMLHQFTGGNASLHIPCGLRLKGALNRNRLETALNQVGQRHDSLRTVFLNKGLGAVREIQPQLHVALLETDLRAYPGALMGHVHEEIRLPFDLESGPLWRVTLFQLADDQHLLVLVFHHIIFDLQSLDLFLTDLAAAYEDKLGEYEPAGYGRFVAWQRGHDYSEHLKWWVSQLQDPPTPAPLPFDRSRLDQASRSGGMVSVTLSAMLTARLRAWSAEQGHTLYITLLTAFKAMLAQVSGAHDLIVGCPMGGRTLRGLEHTLGFFAHPLPVRTRLQASIKLQDLLAQVKASVAEVLQHQAPLEQIIGAVRPPITRAHHPLFQTMFSFYDRALHWHTPGLYGEPCSLDKGATDFDLFLTLTRKGDALYGELEYDTALFEEETVQLLKEAYLGLLEEFLVESQTPVQELPLSPALAACVRRSRLREQVTTVLLAGSFTAEPLEESLRFWLETRAIKHRVMTTPYNQILPQLLDPGSALNGNTFGYNVVLLRLEDWYRADVHDQLQDNVDALIAALGAGQLKVPLLLCLCPASEKASADAVLASYIEKLNERLLTETAALAGITCLNTHHLDQDYDMESFLDAHLDAEAHIPYRDSWFAALGTYVMRWIDRLQRSPLKVIALDCDNTLWQGACGELGPQGIELSAETLALQAFMKEKARLGWLLTLCSKNVPADVNAVFMQREGMILSRADFVDAKINWQAKSVNLVEQAASLNLDPSSFILVEDNPLEIAEVNSNLPAVTTVALPVETGGYGQFLARHWAFDQFGVSSADERRGQMVQENQVREAASRKAPSYAEFIAELHLEIHVEPVTDLARAAQLDARTNQFRCHPDRMGEVALNQALANNLLAGLEISVRDRFGDYGIVGLILFKPEDVSITTFLLSCRALGRGVEHHVVAHLGAMALSAGHEELRFRYQSSDRNRPASDFLLSQPGRFDGEYFIMSAADAALCRFDARGYVEPSRVQQPALQADASSVGKWQAPDAALMLANGETLLQLVRLSTLQRQARMGFAEKSPYVPAETQTQRELVAMFEEVLGVDKVGINDNFLALGGYSLQGIKLISRIQESYGIDLPLALFFDGPTVAALASNIESLLLELAADDDMDGFLSEIEGLSDEEIAALLASEENEGLG